MACSTVVGAAGMWMGHRMCLLYPFMKYSFLKNKKALVDFCTLSFLCKRILLYKKRKNNKEFHEENYNTHTHNGQRSQFKYLTVF